jgi:23S rRNA (guanosine2251-2'-O)-methyltransferase
MVYFVRASNTATAKGWFDTEAILKCPAFAVQFTNNMKTEIIYGYHPVFEALKAARRKIFKVQIAGDKPSGRLEKVAALAASLEVDVSLVKTSRLNQVAGTARHQGVGATVSRFPLASIAYIVDKCGSEPQNQLLVLLDSVLDPQNLGAIIRTAVAVGVDAVVIPKNRSASPTPAVSKASAGAMEHVNLARVTNMVTAIEMLKAKGIWIFGLDRAADLSMYSADLAEPVAVVIGGEEKGIRPLVKQHCDSLVSIPQKGPVNSLNASAAAAVVMYEVFRQRAH